LAARFFPHILRGTGWLRALLYCRTFAGLKWTEGREMSEIRQRERG